jgi:uncharacterized protein involved in exopolysaccharide biosynthesis
MALPQSYVTVSRRPPDVEDYIDMLRRYRSWIIGPMFFGLIAATVVAFLWPDTYVSYATLRITPPQVSDRLVPAEYSTQMMQQLNTMEQDILSRSTLEGLIKELNLYKRQQTQRPMEDIVSDMRVHDIIIKPIQVPNANQSDTRQTTTAFSISFTYPDRYLAQAVVQRLVSQFVNKSVDVQRTQASVATTFFDDELKQKQQDLTKLDSEIEQFKIANNGKLPEELTSNTTMLNNLQLQVSQLAQTLQNAQDRKASYESQLEGEIRELNYLKDNAEETVTPLQTAQAQAQSQELTQATLRLQQLNEALAALSQTLGAKSPQIREIKGEIAAAQQNKDRIEKEQKQKEAEAAADTPAPVEKKVPNRAAQSQMVNVQAQIDNTRTLIAGAEGNIKTVQNNQANVNKQIALYEARIEAAPLNERQWAALQRDHILAQQAYDETVKKKEQAETAQNLEEHKAGQMLEVLDQPTDPQEPVEPKRVQWAATGTGLGLLLGIVLAGAKEMKNTSLKNLKDVRAYTNLPVLSSIPLLENALLVRRKRRLFWLAWSAAFIFGSIAVLASVYYYYAGQK